MVEVCILSDERVVVPTDGDSLDTVHKLADVELLGDSVVFVVLGCVHLMLFPLSLELLSLCYFFLLAAHESSQHALQSWHLVALLPEHAAIKCSKQLLIVQSDGSIPASG